MAQVGRGCTLNCFQNVLGERHSKGTVKPVTVIYLSAETPSKAWLWPSASRANEICQEQRCFSDENRRQQGPHKRLLVWKHWKSHTAFIYRQLFEWDYILLCNSAQPADVTAVPSEGSKHMSVPEMPSVGADLCLQSCPAVQGGQK